jgi:hypothetical protein
MSPIFLVVASFFLRGLYLEPLSFWGYLFFHQRSLLRAPCILWLPLFSSEVFPLSPLQFGVASSFIGGLCFEILVFWGCLFLHQRSLLRAPCILGLTPFSSDVIASSPLCFGAASFFIGGFCFELMNIVCKRTIIHGFGLPGITTFVEYRASVPSDFDDGYYLFVFIYYLWWEGGSKLILLLWVQWVPPH